MITTKHKHDIVSLIERESSNLGSYTKVAAKLGVSNAYITEIRKPERWFKFPDKAWSDIAGMLNYRVDSEKWQIADITNFQWLTAALENAKQDSMCIGISEKAGSGKTKSLESFLKNDTTSGVFLIRCEAWGYRVFLEKVCREVGIKLSEKRHTCEDMLEQIIAFFRQRSATTKPILMLDETDKLKPASLQFIISFYNALERECGLVICGTQHLKKKILNGAAKNQVGFDEILSRIGSRFLELPGSQYEDVAKICQANGVSDTETISAIWAGCDRETRTNGRGKITEVVTDLRRVERSIVVAIKRQNKQ